MKQLQHYKNKKILKKIIPTYKIGKEIVTFGSIEIEKQESHSKKNSISLYDVNIDRIVVSNNISFVKKCFQYFIRYKNEGFWEK